MSNRFVSALDSVHAEQPLKGKTFYYLQRYIKYRVRHRLLYAACALSVLFACLFSFRVYYMEKAYIDMDMNPSVELTLNRFDRVIDVHAYNAEGEDILSNVGVKHRKYGTAVNRLLEEAMRLGYIGDDGFVSVTLQTDDKDKETELLTNIETGAQKYVKIRHANAQVLVFPVSGDVRSSSHEWDLTPAKYLAIMELQEVDPSVTFEGCRHHTIGEIKGMTDSYGAGAQNRRRHGAGGGHHGRH